MTPVEERPVFPVAEYEVGLLPREGVVLMRLGFYTHASQKLEDCDPGRMYALYPDQVRELIAVLSVALDQLETPPEATPRGTTSH